MKKTNLPLRLLCICLIIPFIGFSQNSDESYYNWFDSLISIQNAGLYTGKEYIDTDRAMPDAHKFFQTPKFVKGDVVFQGQTFYNVDVKYNVFEDKLVVKLANQASETTLAPIKDFTRGFTIDNHHFVLLDNQQAVTSKVTGYHELLLDTDQLRLFKKYNKSRSTKFDTGRSFFEYKDAKPDYYVEFNNAYSRVNTKKEIIKLFPQFKKEINGIRENKNKADETATDKYIRNVMQRVQGLLSNSNNAN